MGYRKIKQREQPRSNKPLKSSKFGTSQKSPRNLTQKEEMKSPVRALLPDSTYIRSYRTQPCGRIAKRTSFREHYKSQDQ